MPKSTEDLTGTVYGRLTVLQFAGMKLSGGKRPQRFATWELQCECGNIVLKRAALLKNGSTKSCGCLQKENASATGKNNALPLGTAAANELCDKYRSNAKKRKYECTLSDEEMIELFKLTCHYCGDSPSQTFYKEGNNGEFVYNGIDRIDNKIGYTLENCVSCCGRCNRAKQKDSLEEFEAWIQRICEYQYDINH
jgi:hypothetical protein